MRLCVPRETLLKPLQLAAAIADKNHLQPILSSVLLVSEGERLLLIGSDLEVELVGIIHLDEPLETGTLALPARKLLDICRSLPEFAVLKICAQDSRVTIQSGRSRFVLSAMLADDFPSVQKVDEELVFSVSQQDLKALIDKTYFSMAQQDVRYYLNGLLLQLRAQSLAAVATDGHRLAIGTISLEEDVGREHAIIVPRKGVVELLKLLKDEDTAVTVTIDKHHLAVRSNDFMFSSKLIEGNFPDYRRVLPQGGDRVFVADCAALKQAITRATILSSEKHRGVRLQLTDQCLTLSSTNPDEEQAEEKMAVDYEGEAFDIGFNAGYLLDVVAAIGEKMIKFVMSDPKSSALLELANESSSFRYVVMPLHV